MWSFNNNLPIHNQLVEKIEMLIINDKYKKGEKIPSVREFSLIAKVNPNTMQKALGELENLGLIITERTNGKFVTTDGKVINKVKAELAEKFLKSFTESMHSIGYDKKEMISILERRGKND